MSEGQQGGGYGGGQMPSYGGYRPQQPPNPWMRGQGMRGYGMKPMSTGPVNPLATMNGTPQSPAISDPPGAFGFPRQPPSYGGAPQTKPMQMPQTGGWNPSMGGNRPMPFYGNQSPAIADPPGAFNKPTPPPSYMPQQNFASSQNSVQAQPLQQPQSYQQWQQENASLIRPQQDMGQQAWQAMQPKAGPAAPAMPPMPTGPMQPGQAGYYYGPPPMGTRDSPFGWNAQFKPGENEYTRHMLLNYGNQQGWAPKIDWNNAVQSIGQLSGHQFNPADWSR